MKSRDEITTELNRLAAAIEAIEHTADEDEIYAEWQKLYWPIAEQFDIDQSDWFRQRADKLFARYVGMNPTVIARRKRGELPPRKEGPHLGVLDATEQYRGYEINQRVLRRDFDQPFRAEHVVFYPKADHFKSKAVEVPPHSFDRFEDAVSYGFALGRAAIDKQLDA